MEDFKMQHIPVFGNWNFCDELPITQYFESATQAGLNRGNSTEEDADLFKVPEPKKQAYSYHHHHEKVGKGGAIKVQLKEKQRKQGKFWDAAARTTSKRTRVPKAVDEDLYKIPPELLYKKPKRTNLLRSFWLSCAGLTCIH